MEVLNSYFLFCINILDRYSNITIALLNAFCNASYTWSFLLILFLYLLTIEILWEKLCKHPHENSYQNTEKVQFLIYMCFTMLHISWKDELIRCVFDVAMAIIEC